MDKTRLLPKTSAKSVYCLTDKDLEALEPVERPNPRNRSGPPMKLFDKGQLEQLAVQRWGSMARLEAERARRQQKREQRSILSYLQQPASAEGAARAGSEAGSLGDVEPPGCGSTSSRREAQGQGALPTAASSGDWRAGLRQPLAARVHALRPPPPQQQQQQQQQEEEEEPPSGSYVLYWMSTAVRVRENPALDVAVHASQRLGLPLVVASFLLASHPFATARRYKFVLEGLRDVQAELRQQGGDLLVYLEGHTEPGQPLAAAGPAPAGPPAAPDDGAQSGSAAPAADDGQGRHAPAQQPAFCFHPRPGFQQTVGWRRLAELAGGAAVVVTEDMPVPPDRDWLLALASELPPGVQLCAVDTACVLPMRSVGRSFDKAYAFRAATAARRQAGAQGTYAPAPGGAVVGPSALAPFRLPPAAPGQQGAGEAPAAAPLRVPRLGWQPLELASLPEAGLPEALCALVAGCGEAVDQSVPPVSHMVGGSRAGYQRWEAFRRQGLALYAARRNDPLQRDGVSRLSAYHHWGMVSPFKVAREAALDKSGGAAKYLDEFLTWRELSYVFCLHNTPRLHSLAALPRWAQQTLERHAGDPRSLKSLGQLAAGQTGDAFWDAAQSQLARTGELANNARMTWGKALLGWTPSPLQALLTTLHLNHLYALDGCNPASYAGVLWCFGLFDAPKGSEATPVTGSLAARPTSWHAQRLNPEAYRALPP